MSNKQELGEPSALKLKFSHLGEFWVASIVPEPEEEDAEEGGSMIMGALIAVAATHPHLRAAFKSLMKATVEAFISDTGGVIDGWEKDVPADEWDGLH